MCEGAFDLRRLDVPRSTNPFPSCRRVVGTREGTLVQRKVGSVTRRNPSKAEVVWTLIMIVLGRP